MHTRCTEIVFLLLQMMEQLEIKIYPLIHLLSYTSKPQEFSETVFLNYIFSKKSLNGFCSFTAYKYLLLSFKKLLTSDHYQMGQQELLQIRCQHYCQFHNSKPDQLCLGHSFRTSKHTNKTKKKGKRRLICWNQ